MSQLYYTETGSVVHNFAEELADFRRARKLLELPATAAPARIFVLARSYPDNSLPLRFSVNGREAPSIMPMGDDLYAWYEAVVAPDYFLPGQNVFEFWTDSPAMNSWSLAFEDGHRDPQSFVSHDFGATWRNERMGYLNVARGEYVVRVRLAEGEDPTPPAVVWEDPAHPRLARLRAMLPKEACEPGPVLDRVHALTSWVSTQWEYRCGGPGAIYAPWDPETIIAWGKAKKGHAGELPIVMCVHYAVTLAACCQAVGIAARCGVFMGTSNGHDGHFTAEVWCPEYGKWAFVDPTLDAVVYAGEAPLSVSEIQKLAGGLLEPAKFGRGREWQMGNPVVSAWLQNNFAQGLFIRHRSVWARTDFLSHPEFSPAGHGSVSYCETGLIWDKAAFDNGFAMFPYYAAGDYFDAPPSGFPG